MTRHSPTGFGRSPLDREPRLPSTRSMLWCNGGSLAVVKPTFLVVARSKASCGGRQVAMFASPSAGMVRARHGGDKKCDGATPRQAQHFHTHLGLSMNTIKSHMVCCSPRSKPIISFTALISLHSEETPSIQRSQLVNLREIYYMSCHTSRPVIVCM